VPVPRQWQQSVASSPACDRDPTNESVTSKTIKRSALPPEVLSNLPLITQPIVAELQINRNQDDHSAQSLVVCDRIGHGNAGATIWDGTQMKCGARQHPQPK